MPILISRPLLFASLLLTAVGARAQLAMASPFLPPPGARGAASPTADAPLEFRGVAELPGGLAFRVVDPAHKIGAWVHLNERDPDLGVIVKQHDPAHDTVMVEHQGRTLTLALHQSKVASSGAVMPNALPLPQQMPAPTIPAMAPAPAAPLQQSQIDAVAAAVAQRRALRDQAAQQINQGVRIAPQVIQQQQQQRAQGAVNQNQPGQNPPNAPAGQNGQRGQRRNRQQ